MFRARFGQHRPAMYGLCVLILLYGVALFADVFVVNDPTQRHVAYAYAPPQTPRLSVSEGLWVPYLEPTIDQTTRMRIYRPAEDRRVSLSLLPRVEPFRLWGAIPLERRWLGIDQSTASQAGQPAAVYFPLGADRYGRCIFSRILSGARVSLSIGLIGVTATLIFGIVIGGISGYVGGRTDLVIQRIIEIVTALPQLPLWIALAAVLPQTWTSLQTYFAITVVLSLLNWTRLARVVRGKILSLREEDYAVAAELLGASHGRVLFRHLVPGFTSHILVVATLSVPQMILGETALSFLGLGLRPPSVSWGVMLQDCMDVKAVRFYPWLFAPALVLVATVLSFNFVGDGLRDAADPHSSR
jgi:peptide/nickel transport system permease protein